MKARGAIWPVCRLLLLGSVLCVCVACGSVISKDVRQTADLSLHFGTVVGNPPAYTGKVVLWAGTVLEATNLAEATRLIILHFPRGSRDRPLTQRATGGRFVVLAPGYLETAVYRAGRAITVVGEIRGQQELPLGDTTYRYPVLEPRELYLWQEGYAEPRVHFGFGFGFHHRF